MSEERISTGYVPRQFQAVLHKALKRFSVLVCHRRFGKTVFTINHTLDKGLRCPLRNPQYAYVAPNYGQAKRVAWDMLKEYTKNIPKELKVINEAELRLDIIRPDRDDRVRFLLLGAENPGSLRGIYLMGVVIDEFAECDPTVWSQVIRPALSDHKGWAIFIGTPKGQNHFFDVYQTAKKNEEHDWFHAMYKASDTKVIDQYELAAAKREMAEEEYEQEFECSFTAALIGSYYGKILETAESEGRIKEVRHDPSLPVDTYWDLGIGDTTAIWFVQQLGSNYHIIDYLEQSGEGLDFYGKQLQDKKYQYRDHYLPHDGGARDLGTGKTRQESLRLLLNRNPIVLPRHVPADGIHASRMILSNCWFDRVKCERGLMALRNYQRKWDAKNKLWSTKALHNWASNGADAFRTFSMGVRPDHTRKDPRDLQAQADNEYDMFGGIG